MRGLAHALNQEQLREPIQHVLGSELSTHVDRQALPCVLVHDCEHPEWPPIVGPVEREVVSGVPGAGSGAVDNLISSLDEPAGRELQSLLACLKVLA